MPQTQAQRLDALVRLLRNITGDPDPDSRVHKSPLLPEEKDITSTVVVLAARYPEFNAQGLGFDIPGTGDWPAVIAVFQMHRENGRSLNEEAMQDFFGVNSTLAQRMVNETPSVDLLQVLARYQAHRLANKIAA
jgi:hypothetical protein